jgi:hypothetical protein
LPKPHHFIIFVVKEGCVANDQGRRHVRKNRRHGGKINTEQATMEMRFVYDDDYVWENHVIGRLPFKEPDEVEIVFHNDKLWQDVDWLVSSDESSSEDEA